MNSLLNVFRFIGSLIRHRGNSLDALLHLFEKNNYRPTGNRPYTLRLGLGAVLGVTVTADVGFVHEILVERAMEYPKAAWKHRVSNTRMSKEL